MEKSTKVLLSVLVIAAIALVVSDLMGGSYNGPEFISEPIQMMMEPETITHFDKDGNAVEITLLAEYSVDAGVKGTKNYVTDGASSVSPKDVVLAWGDLNNPLYEDYVSYSQSGRWFYYRTSDVDVISPGHISLHAANTHLIPADETVKKAIKKIKTNDYVHLEGFLVNVHFDGGDWGSSLTREDTGDKSCEIFYVTEVIIY